MNEHDTYMQDFMTVFAPLERWGPGSEEESLKVLSYLPADPEAILEIGCGKGLTTLLLAHHTRAEITAVDNEQAALTGLEEKAEAQGLSSRITPVNANMTELPFEQQSFDLIWAEGCAYIMGVQNALAAWKPLLKANGVLMVSDLVWLTDSPSSEAKAFWQQDYPDLQTIASRTAQIKEVGFEVIESFTLSQQAWDNYSIPLRARVNALKDKMGDKAAIQDIERELELYRHYLAEFGYHMYLLRPVG